jgi:serine/threonine protein kinase
MTAPRPDGLSSGDGRPLALGEVLARGGEGTVWTTDRPGLLAKLYHHPTPGHAAKAAALIAARPTLNGRRGAAQKGSGADGLAGPAPPVAWPLDVIRDATGGVCGVLLPRVRGDLTLHALCVPRRRRRLAPQVSWYRLFDIAAALARAVDLTHAAGAVIGDLRADNVLVDAGPPVTVTLIDADSFQIAGLPCPVGSEGTTPPEMIGRDFTQVLRHPQADRFGLAVLLSHLLLGVHPFTGVWRGAGEPPGLDAAVLGGLWPPGETSGPLGPSLLAPPPDALPPPLPRLFTAAFGAGHGDAAARPTPAAWVQGLAEAQALLEPCEAADGHFHAAGTPCPWCALAATTGRDPWPPPADAPAEPRLIDKRLLRAWRRGDRRQAADLWRRHGDAALAATLPPDIAETVAADAAVLPLVERLTAALGRPGTPVTEIARLWEVVAGAPLTEGVLVDGRSLATHGALAEARAGLLDHLAQAAAGEDARRLAELAAWVAALFPSDHWEVRPWRRALGQGDGLPRLAVAATEGIDAALFCATARRHLPEVGLLPVPPGWHHRAEGKALVAACDALILLADGTLSAAAAAPLATLAKAARHLVPVAVGVATPPAGAACVLSGTIADGDGGEALLTPIRLALARIAG